MSHNQESSRARRALHMFLVVLGHLALASTSGAVEALIAWRLSH